LRPHALLPPPAATIRAARAAPEGVTAAIAAGEDAPPAPIDTAALNFVRVAQWLTGTPFAKTRQSASVRLMTVPICSLEARRKYYNWWELPVVGDNICPRGGVTRKAERQPACAVRTPDKGVEAGGGGISA
jgi:hypothetical protein